MMLLLLTRSSQFIATWSTPIWSTTHLVYYPFGLPQYAQNSHFELIPIPTLNPWFIVTGSTPIP